MRERSPLGVERIEPTRGPEGRSLFGIRLNRPIFPLASFLAVLALVVAACGADETEGESPSSTPSSVPSTTTTGNGEPSAVGPVAIPADGFPSGESALDDMTAESFPDPLVPPEDIISGGPPPDGIPPIDDPQFVGVEEADEWLEDAEPVVVLEVGETSRPWGDAPNPSSGSAAPISSGRESLPWRPIWSATAR